MIVNDISFAASLCSVTIPHVVPPDICAWTYDSAQKQLFFTDCETFRAFRQQCQHFADTMQGPLCWIEWATEQRNEYQQQAFAGLPEKAKTTLADGLNDHNGRVWNAFLWTTRAFIYARRRDFRRRKQPSGKGAETNAGVCSEVGTSLEMASGSFHTRDMNTGGVRTSDNALVART
jgi:hypothetical protein